MAASVKLRKTHALVKGVAVNAFDARVAADMLFEDRIITSPNADWVPEFPFANNKSEILRFDDGFWGGHEYSRWPQLHSGSNPHHACIPFSRPLVVDSLTNDKAMWYSPKETDFEELGASRRNRQNELLGRFRPQVIAPLSSTLELFAAKAKWHYEKTGEKELLTLISTLLLAARMDIDQLKLNPTSFRLSLDLFREVQRFCLELNAIVGYSSVILPRMCDTETKQNDVLLRCRGVFTTEPRVVQQMYRIGIPVWYIRPAAALTSETKIFEVVNCTSWTENLSACRPKVNGEWFNDFISLEWDLGTTNLQVIDESSITQFIGILHGFSSTRSKTGTTLRAPVVVSKPGASGSSSSSASRLEASSLSSARQTANKCESKRQLDSSSVGSGAKINHTRHLYIPNGVSGLPDLPDHHLVIRRVLHDLGLLPQPKKEGLAAMYSLPPPFLLIHTDPEKNGRYYHNYLRIRKALISVLYNGSSFSPIRRKIQQWRNILWGKYDMVKELSVGVTSEAAERIYGALRDAYKGMSIRVDDVSEEHVRASKKQKRGDNAAAKVTLSVEHSLPSYTPDVKPIWRGQKIPLARVNADHALRQEIQWDLAENLFRVELIELDRVLVSRSFMTTEEKKRAIALRGVFLCGDLENTDYFTNLTQPVKEYWGSSLDPLSLASFKVVLERWPGCPKRLTTGNAVDGQDFPTMIEFYVASFVKQYHRVPTMPCKVPASLL
ncbi:hypothetical protein DFH11DRAFT_1731065 [Phellopilus nigrolimitatus]|nr:hypothetical protein DFH11DRAFT_1731065 [Phellopilus nigrolimitatus]